MLIRLLHRQLLQTMQAASNSFDDVTQPLAAKRLEQQSYFASATILKCRNYESMTLDMLRLLCGAAHNNNIKTRSKAVDGKFVSKAKKDLILELKEADTMRLTTSQIQCKLSKFSSLWLGRMLRLHQTTLLSLWQAIPVIMIVLISHAIKNS